MTLALEGTSVHVNSSGPGTSLALPAFTTSVATQVFVCILINGGTISSVTGGSLTFTNRVTSVGTNLISLWTAAASSALSGVVFTINFSVAPGFTTADCFAFSGHDTITRWDSNASVPSKEDSGPDPILVSTNNANDVIIAGFRMVNTASPTAGSGFTLISGADYQGVEYKIVSATQTNLSCGLTTGNGDANGCLVDALMAGTGGAAKRLLTLGAG